jgi:ribosomal protein L37AE/L43A
MYGWKMKQSWNDISAELVPQSLCIYCKMRMADELAHGIVHKRNVVPRKQKHINVEENACPVCKGCQPLSETREGRLIAWKWLCYKFGQYHMEAWYKKLPLRIKEVFW